MGRPYLAPGVALVEASGRPSPIRGVPTSETAFVGFFSRGPLNAARKVTSARQAEQLFGPRGEAAANVRLFFQNGGGVAWVARTSAGSGSGGQDARARRLEGAADAGSGLHALRDVPPYTFSLLCLPDAGRLGRHAARVLEAALPLCEERGAFLLADVPAPAVTASDAAQWLDAHPRLHHPSVAFYAPRVRSLEAAADVSPVGAVAGVYARTDAQRGVWKAPAGTDAVLNGVAPLSGETDAGSDAWAGADVNTIRAWPDKPPVVWGARTSAPATAPEWRYVPVRRLALFLQNSLQQGLVWTAFEPDGPSLRQRVIDTVQAFLQDLFRAGAFQGNRPDEAFFVRCEGEAERPVLQAGFAPQRPAEFIILSVPLAMAGPE